MHKIVLLLAITSVSACNFAPAYRQPVAPISAAYPVTPEPANSQGLLATDLGWRDYFLDPRLRSLIGMALERNRDLAQAVARIAQARAQYRIQDSQRLPALEANGGATRSVQPVNALGFPGAGTGGGDAPSSLDFTQYSANVGVASFELDLWGRLRNLSNAERQRWLASIEGERAARLTLIGQVAAAYFDILAGEDRIALAERTLSGRLEGVRSARKRLDAGVTSTVDFDQATLLLTQAQTELADIQRTTAQARNLLDVLIGGLSSEVLPMGKPLSHPNQVRDIVPGLPSSLLAARPDILEAEHNLQAANANIGAARAAFFPTISLTGAYGFLSPKLGDLFKGSSEAFNYGGSLNLPIFDWGRRTAQVRLNKAQADELIAAYQRTVQGAFQNVADALIARQRYAEQIAAQTRTVEAQRRLARAARLRYDNGIAIYLELLDAERNLCAAEQSLLQLRATDLQNSVTLYTALGGGLQDGGPRSAPES